MEYVVREVKTAIDSGVNDLTEVKLRIRDAYVDAQRWGGKVIAGHTMRCEPHEAVFSRDKPLTQASDFLFLVMELPDNWEQIREEEHAQWKAREAELEESGEVDQAKGSVTETVKSYHT